MILKFEEYDVNEARGYSDDKFDWICDNIGTWIWREIESGNVSLLNYLKTVPVFKDFQQSAQFSLTNDELSRERLKSLGGFLHRISSKDSNSFIKSLSEASQAIKFKISRFGKSEIPGKRGRPFGSKNRPKSVEPTIDPNIAETIKELEWKNRNLNATLINYHASMSAKQKGIDRLTKKLNELQDILDKYKQEASQIEMKIEKNKERIDSLRNQ